MPLMAPGLICQVIIGVVDPSYAPVEDHGTIHPRWLADQLGDTIINIGHQA